MAIEQQGFLSPQISDWVVRHRKENPSWFSLADSLNRVAQERALSLQVKDDDSQAFVAALLLMRGLSNYQGAVLMVERGMTVEARILVRSCFETVFCLGAAHNDKDFAEILIRDDADRRKKLAKALLTLPDDSSGLGPAETEKLTKFLDELTSSGREAASLQVIQAAKLADMLPVYDTYYRGLSNDAAHPSVVALNRYVRADEEREIGEFRWGPDVADVEDTVSAACTACVYLIKWAIQIFGPETLEEFDRCWATYKALIQAQIDRTDGEVSAIGASEGNAPRITRRGTESEPEAPLHVPNV